VYEYTAITATPPGYQETVLYDPRVKGNLSRDDGFDAINNDFFQYGYDAGTLDATSGLGPRTCGPNARRSSSCQGRTA